MKKMVVFVEGGTESSFVEKLLLEIAGEKNIRIQKHKSRGGGKYRKTTSLVGKSGETGITKYFARIVDCGGDERVRSVLVENYTSLCSEKFEMIIGLRDVRGDVEGEKRTFADVPRVGRWMSHGVPTTPIKPLFILAVMETEAWFLAEHTHFARINPSITLDSAITAIGCDLSTENIEHRPTPAEDLDLIYRTAGERYLSDTSSSGKKCPKDRALIQRTIDVLDFAEIYGGSISDRVSHIKPLIEAVDFFLS